MSGLISLWKWNDFNEDFFPYFYVYKITNIKEKTKMKNILETKEICSS